MSNVFSITAGGLQPLETSGIPLGSVVQSSHWGTSAVIVSESGQYGQQAITTDGRDTHDVAKSQLGKSCIPGWRLTGVVCTPEHCEQLKRDLKAYRAKVAAEQATAHDERDQAIARGKALLVKRQPFWAEAVIVAELKEDDSDSMSDYFASHTIKTLILAWSKHTRDLFPEMRKAARNAPEITADLKEHREKYSMGKGYYLSSDGRHSGWHIRKYSLDYNIDSLALAIGKDPEAYRA